MADDEAGNSPRVFASRYGNCYAKSLPAESYGDKGRTQVFMVGATGDKLAHTYEWYAGRLFLECNVGSAVGPVGFTIARLGPWLRGHRASAADLAIAFYRGDRLLKRYSSLDIAGAADNVSASVSHYAVFESFDGFHWKTGNEYSFHARTVDGRDLSFDAATGELLAAQKKTSSQSANERLALIGVARSVSETDRQDSPLSQISAAMRPVTPSRR